MNLLEKLKAAFEQIKTFLRSLLDKCLTLLGKLKSVVTDNEHAAFVVFALAILLFVVVFAVFLS